MTDKLTLMFDENPYDHLVEIKDHLKAGGILFLLTPNAFSSDKLIKISNMEKLPDEPQAHINLMTIWRLQKLLNTAGFKNISWLTEITDLYIIGVITND